MMAATLIGPAGHSATKPVGRVPGTGHDPAPIPLLLTVDTTARGSGATERCPHVMMVRVKVRKVSLLIESETFLKHLFSSLRSLEISSCCI